MAAKPVTRLKELLGEQQEPFMLEIYLFEKRSQRNMPRVTSEEFSKRLATTNLKKRASQPPTFLKSFYNKFLAINNLLRINTCDARNKKPGFAQTEGHKQECSKQDGLSPAIVTASEDSATDETSISLQRHCYASSFATGCSDSEVSMNRNIQQDCIEEGKLHSPVSVLEDVFSHPATWQEEHRSMKPARISEETILSASIWKLLICSTTEKPSCSSDIQEELEEIIRTASSAFLKSKRTLQQKKQLMLDFVREAMQNQQRETRNNAEIGFEDIGKNICEKIRLWGNQSGDEKNIPRLLESDLVHEAQKWYEFSSIKKEIALEIGDSILEEMKDAVVLQLNFLTQRSTT